MIVGLCTIELRLGWTQSLKDKRSEIKGLQNKIRSKFNVSVAETAFQDIWGQAELSLAAVSSERRHAESVITEVIKFIERNTQAEVVAVSTEYV